MIFMEDSAKREGINDEEGVVQAQSLEVHQKRGRVGGM